MKIEIDELAGVPLRALMVELAVSQGETELCAALSRATAELEQKY